MTKSKLLAELAGNTYVMLKPSAIEGIGVFAIRDIPKGCRTIFSTVATNPEAWIEVPRADIENLPPYARHLVENYCLYDEQHYFVPENGFKKVDLVQFLNHSDLPNVVSVNDGEFFEAIEDIFAGEELVVDYGELVEDAVDNG
jgi:SET domain-containing protein